MALITHIAGADIFKKTPALYLTEDEYMAKYYQPEGMRIQQEGASATGAAKRGAAKLQRQVADAQLGGGRGAESTSMGEAVVSGIDPMFRRLGRKQRLYDRLRRARAQQRIAARRESERAAGLSQAAQVGQVESAGVSAVPFAGPFMAGATQMVAGAMQPALAERSKPGTYRPAGDMGVDVQGDYWDEGRGAGLGGGGLYDLYNLAT